MHFPLLAVLLSLILPVSAYQKSTQADQTAVKGVLTADGKTTQLNYGYVIDYGSSLRILLTDKPMTHDEVDGWDHDIIQKRNLRGFMLEVEKDTKRLESANGFHEILTSASFNIDDLDVLEIESLDDKAVAGRLHSGKTETLRDKPYTYDVKFNLRVKAQFDPAAVRVIGEGVNTAPGKAFAAYHKAVMTGSDEELSQYISEAQLAAIKRLPNPKALKITQDFLREMKPAELTIKKLEIQGDTATLSAEGSRRGKKVAGTIKMKLENGMWKIYEEGWKSN